MNQFALAATVALIGLSGCLFKPDRSDPDPDPIPPPLVYHLPTSPDSVLMNLEISYRFKDITGYDGLIDDSFVFMPSPEDPDIEFEQLNKTEDYNSTNTMFREVVEIEINLAFDSFFPSTREEEYDPEEGYMMIQVSSVYLAVETNEQEDGSPITWLVNGDPALFIFKPDSTVSPVTWKIVYQDDQHQ